MNALAGLMNPAAIGQSLQQSFEQGQAKRREMDGNNALTAYAMNPDDPAAFKGLAQFHPQAALQVRQQRDAAAKEQRMGEIRAAAAQGDPKAKAALWAGDPDLAMKLDDRTAKKATEGFEFLGNAAFDIVQRPPEQQPALWDQYIDQAVALGYEGLAQYRGKYSPQTLNSFVAKVDGMKEFMTFQQPKYIANGESGLTGLQYGQPIQQGGEVRNFAPQGAQASQAPPPAAVELLRSNPALKADFDAKYGPGAADRAMGGPAVPPSGTFRP